MSSSSSHSAAVGALIASSNVALLACQKTFELSASSWS